MSGIITNILKQIQKQLNQIDNTTANSNKQQIIIKQLEVQVKAMQKQLDKIGRQCVFSDSKILIFK